MNCALRPANAQPASSTPSGPEPRTERFLARAFFLPALALLLSLFAVTPTRAEVLVSTIGQTISGQSSDFSETVASQDPTIFRYDYFSHAQGFTTGGNTGGYILENIEVMMNFPGTETAANIYKHRAELWSAAADGGPGTKLTGLIPPASVISGANVAVAFTAPTNTRLKAGTTYYIVLYFDHPPPTTGTEIRLPTSTAEDTGGEAGWSVEDAPYRRIRPGSTSPATDWATRNSVNLMIRVNGSRVGDVTAPRPPSGLFVESDITTLDLSWASPAETVTGYEVHYTSSATVDNNAAAAGIDPVVGWVSVFRRGTARSQQIADLAGGTKYRVRVRAVNEGVGGSWAFGAGRPLQPPVQPAGTVWSATLNVRTTPNRVGCRNDSTDPASRCSTPETLSEDEFTIGDENHRVVLLGTGGGKLVVDFTGGSFNPIDPALKALNFCVGATAVSLSGARHFGGSTYGIFETTSLSWSVGDTVSLSIGTSCPEPVTRPRVLLRGLSGNTSTDGSDFSEPLPLNFDIVSGEVHYTATVDESVTHVKLKPIAPDADRVQVSQGFGEGTTPTVLPDEDPSATVALNVGTNRFRVKAVTSGEDSFEESYFVTVTRRGATRVTSPDTPDTDEPDEPVDLKPSFGDASIPDQSYMEGRRIEALTLPEATGGDGELTYSLTPVDAIPAGLALATATRVLSGTPTRPQAETRYRWTVTDADGDTASLSFTIEVEAAPVHDPQAWLTRFGRTVGQQMVEAIEDRIDADRTPGFSGTFAGQALPTGAASADETPEAEDTPPVRPEIRPEIGRIPMIDRLRDWLSGDREAEAVTQSSTTALGMNQVITGTAFTLTGESDGGMSLGLWGRGARDSFSGREGGLTLDGDVTSFMLGTDWQRGDHLFGLMLARSQGSGRYTSSAGRGEIESRLTSLVPYANWDVNDRVSVWGAFGIGQGDMTLTPEGETALTTDIAWRMAAAGADGALGRVTALGGADLRWTADALWTRTTSEAAAGILATSGDTTRLRFGLDSSWTREMETGAVLTPSLQLAARHDGGDAETGFGLEIGGGLDWSDPALGLEIGLTGRRLVLHQQDGFEDWGVALTLGYDPTPDTRRGFSASVSRSLGGASSGGVDALLGPQTFPTATGGAGPDSGTWSAEMAYGVSRGRGVVASPYTRISGGGAGQARLGYRVEPDAAHAADMNLDLWVQPGTQDTGETAGGGLNWRW